MNSKRSDAPRLVQKDTSVREHLKGLSPFLSDPDVTEICMNRDNEVWTEKNSVWECFTVTGFDYKHMEAIGIAVAKYAGSGAGFNDSQPILSAVLPDGERIQMAMPPACEAGTISLTIRKPSHTVRRLEDYVKSGFFDKIKPTTSKLSSVEHDLIKLKDEKKYVDFLRMAVQNNKVIVIAGETGSGKTTFMKALMQEIPQHQRLITIEDVPELFLPNHPNHVHLFYPSEAKESEGAVVTSSSLLRSCLRMKPDRILLAELRGGETFDFLNVCLSGHGGSITSCHSGSCEGAFEYLALKVLQNAQGRELPHHVIMRLLYLTIDVVMHVHNDAIDGRHITGIWYDPMKKRGGNDDE